MIWLPWIFRLHRPRRRARRTTRCTRGRGRLRGGSEIGGSCGRPCAPVACPTGRGTPTYAGPPGGGRGGHELEGLRTKPPYSWPRRTGGRARPSSSRPVSSARPASVRRGSDRSSWGSREAAKSRRQQLLKGSGANSPRKSSMSRCSHQPSLARAGHCRSSPSECSVRRPSALRRGWPREGRLSRPRAKRRGPRKLPRTGPAA